MAELPAAIAAEQAILRQSVALSVVKQSAQADQAIAGILEQSVSNVPVSPVRGAKVNIQA